jgi:hypothetical protein
MNSGNTSLAESREKDNFTVARQFCAKAKYSRKTLCAALLNADQDKDGYLTTSELAGVFQRFEMSDGDSASFYSTMGGDQRGLFWREAIAIMAPLFRPEF